MLHPKQQKDVGEVVCSEHGEELWKKSNGLVEQTNKADSAEKANGCFCFKAGKVKPSAHDKADVIL